jgi:serine/threonine protein kinase
MTADATLCLICGAERPANARDETCSHCQTPFAPTGDRVASAGLDSTVAHVASDERHSPLTTQVNSEPCAAGQGQIPPQSENRPGESAEDDDCISVDQFISVIDDLGLLDTADARAFLAKITQARPSCSSRDLGRELVLAGRLTGYQAGAICQGKAKGLVIGRYAVLDKLGAGGMGMVFKAQHRRLKQVVALKILPPSLTRNPELVQRFHREAQTAAKLNHPNIVRAIDADDAGGTHFLVMEFVEGATLGYLVRTQGVFSPAKALDTMIQAARGLAVAHDAGIVHRDIKPSNLMIDIARVVKILDLGLARLTGEHSPDGDSITMSGSLMGTVDFMSPEQAFDPRLADARSDIYSLGCTLYFLLAATGPYQGASLMQRLLAHRDQPVPSLRLRRPDVSVALNELFRKMLAKDPKDRPSSMAELIDRLEACKATAGTGAARIARPLMVFDDAVRIDPPSTPPAAVAPSSILHVDPTPLPRKTAADLDTPRSGSGIRFEDKKQKIYTICETDISGLHTWVEFVRSRDAIPAGVSVFECGQGPTFAAIALPNRRQVAWEFTTHSDQYQFNVYSNTMASRGFQLSLFSPYRVATRRGIISYFRKTNETINQAIDIDLPAVHTTLARIEKSSHRLIYLTGYPTPAGRRFAVFSSSPLLYPQRSAYELTFDALKTFASHAIADDYLPISLTASPAGATSCFAIVLEKVADRGCEMSFGLTPETLANEFDRHMKRGFSPIVLCGFTQANAALYNVGWIKGRLPKGL